MQWVLNCPNLNFWPMLQTRQISILHLSRWKIFNSFINLVILLNDISTNYSEECFSKILCWLPRFNGAGTFVVSNSFARQNTMTHAFEELHLHYTDFNIPQDLFSKFNSCPQHKWFLHRHHKEKLLGFHLSWSEHWRCWAWISSTANHKAATSESYTNR